MFNKNSDAGINRMISRRPIVEENNYSDADSVPTIIKDEIRLNKFIANSGICSRREADTLIAAGVVTVNGQVVTELGQRSTSTMMTSGSTESVSREKRRFTS